MEAYVLAGELHRSGGDHTVAFARYQEIMQPFLRSKQRAAAGFASFFAPRTALGIHFRNCVTGLFRIPFVLDHFVGRSIRDEIILPDYAFDGMAARTMPAARS
jgi:2-polyprenyl-6-methoxyphenol hydroxylase-like FAD-dependent oxidoreductase